MKKIVVIVGVVAILILVIILCNKPQPHVQEVQTVEDINIHSLQNKDLLLTNGIPDSCHFVKLETKDGCMIGHIIKMIVTDSLIFIKDYNKNLFVFNK